jgi:hypothetical protein
MQLVRKIRMAISSVLKGTFVMNEMQLGIFRRAHIRSKKLKECSGEEFSAQPKKILVEEFSGNKFSDKECSNE